MTKQQLKRAVRKELNTVKSRLFSDNYWAGEREIYAALSRVDMTITALQSSEYRKDENGNPNAKQ